MNKVLKLLTFVASSITFGAVAFAGNQALVDTLVKKGYLTSEEAANISKSGMMSSSRQHTTGISFEGLVQVQYDYFNTQLNGNEEATREHRSIPSIRNVKLGVHADLVDDFSAHLVFGNTTTDERTNVAGNMEIDTAIVKWSPMDEFNLAAGYDSTAFGHENSIATKDRKTLDRSVSARYFEHVLGFGRENVGLFTSGEMMEGLYYAASVSRTLGLADNGAVADNSNIPALMAQVGFRNNYDELYFDLGGNIGFLRGAYDSLENGTPANNGEDNQFFALGAYGDFTYMDFNLLAEFQYANVKNGKVSNEASTVFGVTVMPSMKITEDFELVAYYSFLNTGDTRTFNQSGVASRGSAASNLVRGSAGSTSGVAEIADVSLKTWHQFYVGGNWYYLGNDLKISFGYDYTRGETKVDPGFSGLTAAQLAASSSDKIDIHHFGARVQLLF